MNLLFRLWLWWINPSRFRHGFGAWLAVFESLGILFERRLQHLSALGHYRGSLAIMDAGGSEQGDAGVVMRIVVPLEKFAAEDAGIL